VRITVAAPAAASRRSSSETHICCAASLIRVDFNLDTDHAARDGALRKSTGKTATSVVDDATPSDHGAGRDAQWWQRLIDSHAALSHHRATIAASAITTCRGPY
jgi:hypothetical protein